jgi:hypothetical protein
MQPSGYRNPLYAKSLAEFGEPRELPRSGGWLLERTIPGSSYSDAIGCYPMFSPLHWEGLNQDLADLSPSLVSVALVADPFGEYSHESLSLWFDKVVAFKQHHILDFDKPILVSKHHRYYSRKAASAVSIEVSPPPAGFAGQWNSLYEGLVRRHQLKGIKAFSRVSFDLQMEIPGMVAVQAVKNGSLVGAHLWFRDGDVAYSHLAASTEEGYNLNCSYAIHSAVIEYFRPIVRWVDLGGGAGTAAKTDGLSRFKAGWSNSMRPAYFCARILNQKRYHELIQRVQAPDMNYFPAYRCGEFA